MENSNSQDIEEFYKLLLFLIYFSRLDTKTNQRVTLGSLICLNFTIFYDKDKWSQMINLMT